MLTNRAVQTYAEPRDKKKKTVKSFCIFRVSLPNMLFLHHGKKTVYDH